MPLLPLSGGLVPRWGPQLQRRTSHSNQSRSPRLDGLRLARLRLLPVQRGSRSHLVATRSARRAEPPLGSYPRGVIHGRTAEGEELVRICRLDRPNLTAYRRLILDTLDLLRRKQEHDAIE